MSKLKNISMRDITLQEVEAVLAVLEGKAFKLVYLWTAGVVCMLGVEMGKVFLQKRENPKLQVLFYLTIMLVFGVFPSIYENWKEKYRIRCVKNGKVKCVVARCVYRSKRHHSTYERCTYTITTELGEHCKVRYRGRIGKAIETGDLFYLLRIGWRDFIFIRF